MAKSAAFGVMHVGIAFSVGYALTGSLSVAGALTIVEPLCNTVAHFFFDRWWDRRAQENATDTGRGSVTGTGLDTPLGAEAV